jgi:hypothetical protein
MKVDVKLLIESMVVQDARAAQSRDLGIERAEALHAASPTTREAAHTLEMWPRFKDLPSQDDIKHLFEWWRANHSGDMPEAVRAAYSFALWSHHYALTPVRT